MPCSLEYSRRTIRGNLLIQGRLVYVSQPSFHSCRNDFRIKAFDDFCLILILIVV